LAPSTAATRAPLAVPELTPVKAVTRTAVRVFGTDCGAADRNDDTGQT